MAFGNIMFQSVPNSGTTDGSGLWMYSYTRAYRNGCYTVTLQVATGCKARAGQGTTGKLVGSVC